MMNSYSEHYSVMNSDVLNAFKELESLDGPIWFADLTFGAGGHTIAIAEAFPNAKVLSFDQDLEAVTAGRARLLERGLDDRVTIHQDNFENLAEVVQGKFPEIISSGGFAGIVADLGVSSHHFDCDERGFSFRGDGPLDMRMDIEGDLTASDIVNNYSEEEIADIIYTYGEERLSRKIAANIVESRSQSPIERTKQLEEIVFLSYPKKFRHGRTHPATKTFQALRIYVNRELGVLENVIEQLPGLMRPGSIAAVITFHSLEDRIVKHRFRDLSRNDQNMLELMTKKPILPGEKELEENSRSRSAKLRMMRKLTKDGVKNGKKKGRYKD